MPAVEVSALRVAYGDHIVLDDLHLVVPDGAVTAVLGPSGCGKTSLLRVVAGLLRPASGRVVLAGRVVSDDATWVRPEHRRIGVVPQEGALFPHLDVLGNVVFGLDGSRREKSARGEELLELVGMGGTGSLRPQELSGGMQPFSALDAGLRDEVRADVLAAIRADGAAALLVTHDQDEALSAADRVAVMRDGVIVQEGTPTEVYLSPVDLGVARFVGECVELPVVVDADGSLRTALGPPLDGCVPSGAGEVAVLRPEELELRTVGSAGAPARVEGVRFHGHDQLVDVRLADGTPVRARSLGASSVAVGDEVTVVATSSPRVLRG
jgi:iron(III) transport system ATP-binding protein